MTQSWPGAAEGQAVAGEFRLPPRWVLVRKLGEGGQGEVWLAEDKELREPVALKVFRPELGSAARERLRREVKLGRSIQHPGLVRVFELIEAGDRLAMVMEWVPGGSLADRLQSGPLPILEIIEAARQTLDALSALNAQDVVHRDVKPSNLLLDAQGRIKLADLGVARSLGDENVTLTATSVGTPAYMSPEQLMGRPLQPTSDLYSLGATLFELLTGQRPFGESPTEGVNPCLTARAQSPRRLRRDCPSWLARFVLRLLEREPGDRFADAAKALQALDRRRILVSPRVRRRVLAVGLAAVFLAAIVFVAWQRSRISLATATVSGSEVVAIDTRGRELWRRNFPGFEVETLVADVVGDDAPEVIVQLHSSPQGIPEGTRDLFVLSTTGQELASTASSLSTLAGTYPDLEPRVFGPLVKPLDLDDDGLQDLVWIAQHVRWYPSVVGGWNLRAGLAPSVLLVNSGHVKSIATGDVDGDSRPELIVTGTNNPLGYQSFVAVIKVDKGAFGNRLQNTCSPDLLSYTKYGVFSDFAYSVLGTDSSGVVVSGVDSSGIGLNLGGRILRVDATGNPTDSSQFGKGSRAQRALWNDLATTSLEFVNGAKDWKVAVERLEAGHGEVLTYPPMRIAVSLMLGRALASGGNHAGAADLLGKTVKLVPDNLDLWLRLGEQRAMLGQVEGAEEALDRASRWTSGGRRPLDAVVARVLLAGLHGKKASFDTTHRFWAVWNNKLMDSTNLLEFQSLWAFTQADWQDKPLGEEWPIETIPAVLALRAWASLERGVDVSSVRAQAEILRKNPETTLLARLLLARIDAKTGAPERAVTNATAVLADLDRRGRESFEDFAWVPLAERVLGDALVAAGRPKEAIPHLARARALAPGAWFGGGSAGQQRQHPQPTSP